jgi:opacity protein-like surface antigen
VYKFNIDEKEDAVSVRILAVTVLALLVSFPAVAQDKKEAVPDVKTLEEQIRAERARAEIEKARAEAEKAKAEAEKAKAEAELAKIAAEKARLSLAAYQADAGVALEPGQPAPGVHAHDGLFLRFTGGPGFGIYNGTGDVITTAGEIIGDPSNEGSQVGGSISLGGSIGENLILHGDIWFSIVATEKKHSELYQEFGTAVVGLGVTYYWMPVNMYLTGSIGMANSFLVLHEGTKANSNEDLARDITTGVGVAVMVGKEWWVSDNWALGVAIQGEFTYAEDEDSNLIFRHGGAKVLFCATYQ